MAEVTMICVDNSAYLCPGYSGPGLMNAQNKAIQLYCSQKLKAHPDNKVGFTTMGAVDLYCRPSRDLNYISSTLSRLHFAGFLYLPNCLMWALRGLNSSGLSKKRLLMFAGGQLHMTMPTLQTLATALRELNIAVDVVNFGLQDPAVYKSGRKNDYLQAFVAAVNVDGNSRYLHAPAGSPFSLSQNLSSSPIMPHVGQGTSAATATLSLHKETKPHQNDENVDPLGMKKDVFSRRLKVTHTRSTLPHVLSRLDDSDCRILSR